MNFLPCITFSSLISFVSFHVSYYSCFNMLIRQYLTGTASIHLLQVISSVFWSLHYLQLSLSCLLQNIFFTFFFPSLVPNLGEQGHNLLQVCHLKEQQQMPEKSKAQRWRNGFAFNGGREGGTEYLQQELPERENKVQYHKAYVRSIPAHAHTQHPWEQLQIYNYSTPNLIACLQL